MVHGISRFRISEALNESEPENVGDIWRLLQSIGFEPYVVLGEDDFQEMLKHGGHLIKEDFATFDPYELLNSSEVSKHVKGLVGELF